MKLHVKLCAFIHVSDSQNGLWTNNADYNDNSSDSLLSAKQMPNTILSTLSYLLLIKLYEVRIIITFILQVGETEAQGSRMT